MALPDRNLLWAVPMPAVALIAEAEGCRLVAYRCPAGVWTIGWGKTDGVKPGMRCTQQQADEWLSEDVAIYSQRVAALCTAAPAPNELGAMTSLAYNIGLKAFAKSSVLRAHNAGDRQAAARAFALWNKARVGGVLVELAGLTARRAAEAALYLQPEPDGPRERMPQAVEPESSISASPVARGGAATAGVGVVLAAPDLASTLQAQLPVAKTIVDQVRELAATVLGPQPGWVLPVILIAAGAAVVYWRRRQRLQGWA